MSYEREQWVKLYTKSNPRLRALGWEGRALWHELHRLVSASEGVIRCDGLPPQLALSAETGIPEDICKSALDAMVRFGLVVIDGDDVAISDWFDMQASKFKDAERSKSYRRRRKMESRDGEGSSRDDSAAPRDGRQESRDASAPSRGCNGVEESRVEESRVAQRRRARAHDSGGEHADVIDLPPPTKVDPKPSVDLEAARRKAAKDAGCDLHTVQMGLQEAGYTVMGTKLLKIAQRHAMDNGGVEKLTEVLNHAKRGALERGDAFDLGETLQPVAFGEAVKNFNRWRKSRAPVNTLGANGLSQAARLAFREQREREKREQQA